MGLADDLLAPAQPHGGKCSLRMLLARLADEDEDGRDALAAVLAMPMEQMPSTVISRRLTASGYTVSAFSVQRHRRGECKCP